MTLLTLSVECYPDIYPQRIFEFLDFLDKKFQIVTFLMWIM